MAIAVGPEDEVDTDPILEIDVDLEDREDEADTDPIPENDPVLEVAAAADPKMTVGADTAALVPILTNDVADLEVVVEGSARILMKGADVVDTDATDLMMMIVEDAEDTTVDLMSDREAEVAIVATTTSRSDDVVDVEVILRIRKSEDTDAEEMTDEVEAVDSGQIRGNDWVDGLMKGREDAVGARGIRIVNLTRDVVGVVDLECHHHPHLYLASKMVLLHGTNCVSTGKDCLCCCGGYIPDAASGNCTDIRRRIPGIDGLMGFALQSTTVSSLDDDSTTQDSMY
ncbi:unnamed protein product, partial [Mesorhabditis spiculigera]